MKNNNEKLNSVKQVMASMAIEDMYFDSDFIKKIIKIAKGELSSEAVRKEIISQYSIGKEEKRN